MLASGTIYLKITQAFLSDKLKLLKSLNEQGVIKCPVLRSFDQVAYLVDNPTLKNFEVN
jgi:hypothetical protein